MERPVSIPNLPCSKVKSVLYGDRYRKKLEHELLKRNIKSETIPDYMFVSEHVRGHIDLCCCHIAHRKIVSAQSAAEALSCKLLKYGIDCIIGPDVQFNKYPDEIAYNAVVVGNTLFCKKENTTPLITNPSINAELKLINCRQGYAKCSIAVIDQDAIITADSDIAKKATKHGMDVLKISPGHITLDGYPYGFIGGCCMKTSANEIAFTGTLDEHPDKERIENFLTKRNMKIDYLTQEKVFDIGSFILLSEEL